MIIFITIVGRSILYFAKNFIHLVKEEKKEEHVRIICLLLISNERRYYFYFIYLLSITMMNGVKLLLL